MEQRRKSGLLAAALLTVGLVVGAAGWAGAQAGPSKRQDPIERVGTLLTGVTAGSPAQSGLVEERDRLARVTKLTEELDYVKGVFRQASPGSPAQFRAKEEADSLREELRELDPTWEEAR